MLQAEPSPLPWQTFYYLRISGREISRVASVKGTCEDRPAESRLAGTEGPRGWQSERAACSWVWFGPHSVLKKLKIVPKIENQDILH